MTGRALRPYQAEAIQAITTALAHGGSGQLHAACGSGKTLMAMRAAEQLTGPDGLVVVLAPSLGLVRQLLGDWAEHAAIGYQRFAVCSDETVGSTEDAETVHADELGVPVSTDRDQIAKWLTAEGPRLIVGTYLSANHLAAAARRAGREVDMLVCDEAHHLAGNADAHTRRIMDPAVLPARRRLYVTATPRTGRGRDDEQHDTRTLSMNDENAFGPVLYSYPFSRGIAEGYLADYRIAVIGVTDQEVRRLLSRDDVEYVDGIGMRTAAAQVALARAYRDFGMRRAITFHGSVADAQRFVESLPTTLATLPDEASAPAPVCLHANGAMDSGQRQRVLDGLHNPPSGGWAVCSNVRCLSEGVDVPALDGVLFANPKRSTVDIVQAASRALRPHPDTPGLSTLIVPVVVPDEGDDVDAIDPGAYEALFQILRALKEHDDVLSAELNTQRAALAPTGPVCVIPDPDGENDDAPACGLAAIPQGGMPDEPITVPATPEPVARLSKVEFHGKSAKALAKLRLVTLRGITSEWWESFANASAYKRCLGHLRAQRGEVFAGRPLGNWLGSQRLEFNVGRLPRDRRDALDRIGMVWDMRDYAWAVGYESARSFRVKYGHLRVPGGHTEGGYPLGYWIQNQRDKFRRGAMPLAHKSALDEIGMAWGEAHSSRWGRMHEAAIEYALTHGDLDIPKAFATSTGLKLGIWLAVQRRARRDGRLSEERQRLLEELGVDWDPAGSYWAAGIAAASAYRSKHGHLRVPIDHVEDGFTLGVWLAKQRRRLKDGSLPPGRRGEIEALGVVSDFNVDRWLRSYSVATDFYNEHGHLRASCKKKYKGFNLGTWLQHQRWLARQGTLSSQRTQALDAIGMAWDLRQRPASGPVQS